MVILSHMSHLVVKLVIFILCRVEIAQRMNIWWIFMAGEELINSMKYIKW